MREWRITNSEERIEKRPETIRNSFFAIRNSLFAVAASLLAAASAASSAIDLRADDDEALARAVQLQTVVQAALAAVTPSIVRIDTIGGAPPVRTDERGQPARPAFRAADGPTTGVIWSADGYIVTSSFNFARDPTIITVTLADGRRFVARLVARDRVTRLALLKIDAAGLPAAEWLALDAVRPGQYALAAGFGHGGDAPALSVGIVSAQRRMNGLAVQTDARISPANYGGPLFDIDGRVIGVCVPMGPGEDELADAQWYDSGIGFAVHHGSLADRVARMMNGVEPRRGLLGVVVDPRAPVRGLETGEDASPEGVRVVEEPVGPAARAGLAAGDIITHIDGAPTPRVVDFRRALILRGAGEEVEVSYWRAGESATVRLTLAAQSELAAAPDPEDDEDASATGGE